MRIKKLNLVFVVLIFCNYAATAQIVENTINFYGTNFPQEKIHIHFDKESYLPGETIWFKAYVFEEYLPSARSTNFYASLYDEEGKLIQQQLCPIFGSSASGHFEIPDSLQSKQLICRAYTSWMQNFDSSFLFTKSIPLINNKAKGKGRSTKTVSLQFFPEGGDIIQGTSNTIAFKANYNNGLPFEINGAIKKQETGEIITSIKSVHDGMGRFDLDVNANEKYYAEWTDDKGMIQKTYLPNAKAAGVSLKLVQQKDKVFFNITNKLPNDSLHVLMYMYQKIFYATNLSVHEDEPYTASVTVKELPAGVMQATVFDANWQPVAERIAFIDNHNYTLSPTITNKDISLQKRAKNTLEIDVPDTIPSNMSLSVTDADMNNDEATSTIVTDFLLSGDIKGYVHNPSYYFSTDKNAASNLDLVMLTHGWRRYNWSDITAGKMPAIKYPVDNYLMLYGQVNKSIANKLDKEELVNVIVRTKDSTQNFYQLRPDATGFVKKEGMIFYDTARVLYSFKKDKLLNPRITFSPSNYTYGQPTRINNYSNYLLPDTTGINFNSTATIFNYYNGNKANRPSTKDKTLQTVVVKNGSWHNWKNDPKLKMDERYTTGLFRGVATSESFDVAHDVMASAKGDIYEYLRGKVPGLFISNNGGKHLDIGPDGAISSTRSSPVFLYIDENEADNYQLAQLNIDDVAFIKYFMHSYGRKGSTEQSYPTLAIYLKKGEDLIDHTPRDDDQKLVKVPGYSPYKEFYSPDYTESNATIGTDARITLLWLPYIVTDKNNLKIPVTFYNNDFSKRLRIVLEGINDEGKLIHLEKILE